MNAFVRDSIRDNKSRVDVLGAKDYDDVITERDER